MMDKTQMLFARLMGIYVLWTLAWVFAGSLFEVYFFDMGMPLTDIYLANATWFMAGILTVPFIRGFKARDSMLIGTSISIIAVLLLLFFHAPWAAYAFRFIVGFTHVFFWAPFNTLYYRFSKGNNATLGAIYYAVLPLLSLFAPALAGFIATVAGFNSLFILATFLFVLVLALILALVDNHEHKFDFHSAMVSIDGLKSLIFMEGFAAAMIISATLPLMLVTFVSSPLEFGGITSLITIFSLLAAFFTAQISDHAHKRGTFLIPSILLFCASAVLASYATDLTLFFIAFGLVTFFSRIFFPLPLALAVDNSKSLSDTMLGREFMLNAGRFSGALLGYAVFLAYDLNTVLLLQAALLMLMIPLYEEKKKKLTRH